MRRDLIDPPAAEERPLAARSAVHMHPHGPDGAIPAVLMERNVQETCACRNVGQDVSTSQGSFAVLRQARPAFAPPACGPPNLTCRDLPMMPTQVNGYTKAQPNSPPPVCMMGRALSARRSTPLTPSGLSSDRLLSLVTTGEETTRSVGPFAAFTLIVLSAPILGIRMQRQPSAMLASCDAMRGLGQETAS